MTPRPPRQCARLFNYPPALIIHSFRRRTGRSCGGGLGETGAGWCCPARWWRRAVCRRGAVDVAVARADDEVGAADADAYLAPLLGLRLARGVVAEAVLAPQLLGDVVERLLKVVDVLRVVVAPAGRLRETAQVLA